MNTKYDIIVIGAGLVGLSAAYHLKKSFPDRKVLIVEKENSVAAHQSGHNSGVMHSGIYYTPGSLKAQNCISGYRLLIEFAEQYSIPFDICGKLIVATAKEEIPMLAKIHERGIGNGLKGLRMISANQIKEIEPYAVGEAALLVPQAGIIDYKKVAQQLLKVYMEELGGDISFNEEVKTIKEDKHGIAIGTNKNNFISSYMMNCGGLHADRILSIVHKSNDLRIVPFKGIYYKLKPEKERLVKNLIYPVPDPKFPFLGVHFTRMINGGIEAGPNAVLSLKREGYKANSISLRDTLDTFSWPGFWKIAMKYGKTGLDEAYRSISKRAFTRALKKLLPEIEEDDLVEGGAGVRAQACSRDGKLVDDFDFKVIGRTMHVRNAPSPAATSCLSIGRALVDKVSGIMTF